VITYKMNEKIVQIIPADDWLAVFKMDDEAELSLPLNCWALCQEEDGSSRIEGIYVDAAVIAPRPNRPPISCVTKDFQRLSPDT